jgi:hypothetical protein
MLLKHFPVLQKTGQSSTATSLCSFGDIKKSWLQISMVTRNLLLFGIRQPVVFELDPVSR